MKYITSTCRLAVEMPNKQSFDLFGLEPKPVMPQMINFLEQHPLSKFMKLEDIPEAYKKKFYPNCLDKKPNANVLIIRYGGIGDILWTTPVIRGIKEKYPYCKIKYSVFEKDRELLYNNPYIDGLITTTFPTSKDLDWADFVLDFYDSVENNEEAKVKDPIDISCEWAGITPSSYLPIYIIEKHETEWAKMFLSMNGYSTKNKLIGMPLTASSPNRTWLGYHELLEMILKTYKDVNIVLLGNLQHGLPIITRIKNLLKEFENRIIDGFNKTTLRQSFAVLNECDIVFTPDTGSVPVCGSLGKKTLALYSTVPKSTRIKYYPTVKGIQADVPCAPCYKLHGCEYNARCMNAITPYRVFIDLKEMIEGVIK